jgi:methyl-accepting chemotaxis protein
MTQMDRVTQTNAANAEESASASEELSAQARELNEMVAVLIRTVRGANATTDSSHKVAEHHTSVHQPSPAVTWTSSRRPVAAADVRPEAVIPLDDRDLADF